MMNKDLQIRLYKKIDTHMTTIPPDVNRLTMVRVCPKDAYLLMPRIDINRTFR